MEFKNALRASTVVKWYSQVTFREPLGFDRHVMAVSVLQSAHPETVPSERQLKGHPAPGVSGDVEGPRTWPPAGEWSLSRSPCGLQENLGHVRRVCARYGRQQGQIVRLDPVGMHQIRLLNKETQTCITTSVDLYGSGVLFI